MRLNKMLKMLNDEKKIIEPQYLDLFYKVNKDTIYYGSVYPNEDGNGSRNTLTLWVPEKQRDLWLLNEHHTVNSYTDSITDAMCYSRLRTLTGSVKKFCDLVLSKFNGYKYNGFRTTLLQDGIGNSERFVDKLEYLEVGDILVAPYTKRY